MAIVEPLEVYNESPTETKNGISTPLTSSSTYELKADIYVRILFGGNPRGTGMHAYIDTYMPAYINEDSFVFTVHNNYARVSTFSGTYSTMHLIT